MYHSAPIYVGAANPNLSPCVVVAGTSLTRPSPKALKMFHEAEHPAAATSDKEFIAREGRLKHLHPL